MRANDFGLVSAEGGPVAERERFELSRPLRAYGISSAAPSTELGDYSVTSSPSVLAPAG
jgi:hypothetical protein